MYYDENTIIYTNGNFIKAVEAKGNLYDQSLHYGYAVFEGIRAYPTTNGVRIFKAEEHFERLKCSCEAVGIPYPFENNELIAICYELLQRNKLTDAYLRPLVTCTPNMSLTKAKVAQILIAAWQWGAYLGNKQLRLKTSTFRRIAPACFVVEAKVSGHYVNSILATQEANDAGFDEALMLDIEGFVAEGPGANIFIEKDNALYTPARGSILPGITRSTIISLCQQLDIPIIEKRITPEELYSADSAFYCGTAAEVIGIQSVDDIPFRQTWSESVGATIQTAYKNLVLEKQASPEKVMA
jgi:branched-chain amino acid aminotransferase